MAQILAAGAAENPAPSPFHRFPVAVLSIDAPWYKQTQRSSDLGSLLRDLLKSGSDSALEQSILSKGGSWRILQTPQVVQLGLFLPMAPPEAETIVKTLIERLVSRFSTLSWSPRSAGLADIISGHVRADSRVAGKISLWVSSPLHDVQNALVAELRKLPPLPETLDPATAPSEVTLPEEPPTFVQIMTWDGLTPCSLASARFFGERINQLNKEPALWRYDVWALPDKVSLIMLATSSLDQLHRLPPLAQDLQEDAPAICSGTDAASFLKNWLQVIEEDRSNLEKGAFLQAWESHVDMAPVDCASAGIRSPSRSESIVVLPSSHLHRFLFDSGRSPTISALRHPIIGNRAELAITIQATPSVLETMVAQLDRRDLALPRRPTLRRIGEDLLLVQTSAPLDNLSAVVSILRNYLLSSTVSPIGSPASGAISMTSVAPASLEVTILGVADIQPFHMLSKLREGWPQRNRESSFPRHPLDIALLASTIDLASATPRLLQGRWLMRSSTPSGMAQILVHLLARGADFQGPEAIENLLGTPTIPLH